MSDIKIYVSCHKKCYVPKNDLFVPVHVGSTGKPSIEGTLRDDEGDNISALNPYYCELTAQYWAWKNQQADYYGFFHYRRFFSFSGKKLPQDAYKVVYLSNMSKENLDLIGFNEEKMKETIEKYDLIIPETGDISNDANYIGNSSIYQHYKTCKQHHIEDLDSVLSIIKNKFPDYYQSAQKYVKNSKCYFFNMYIMKKELFNEYCNWLFTILEEFHKNRNYDFNSITEYRTPGFLAERLFGMYVTYLQENKKNLKIGQLPIVHFADVENPYPQPAFKENNKVVCLASSDEYSPFLGVTLQSILDNITAKNNYDIFVLSNGISEANKLQISKSASALKNVSIRFIECSDLINDKNLFERDHISKSTYLRFFILDKLVNFEKTVYLDCDLVVNADIGDLYDTDLKTNLFAGARDVIMAAWCNSTKPDGVEQKEYNINTIGLASPFDYVNAGVLLMNLKEIRKQYSSESLMQIALDKDWRWQDQDIINMIANKSMLILDQTWNYMAKRVVPVIEMVEYGAPKEIFDDFIRARNSPKIIHYAGRNLPCYVSDADCSEIFWKYARNSYAYEIVMKKMMAESIMYYQYNVFNKPNTIKMKFKNLLKRLFPSNTRRGMFVRKLFKRHKK